MVLEELKDALVKVDYCKFIPVRRCDETVMHYKYMGIECPCLRETLDSVLKTLDAHKAYTTKMNYLKQWYPVPVVPDDVLSIIIDYTFNDDVTRYWMT